MNKIELVRIRKYATINGTFYIPQRIVYKSHWFSPPTECWEDFCIMNSSSYGDHFSSFNYESDKENKVFESIKYAEYICDKWIKVNNKENIVKTYYQDAP